MVMPKVQIVITSINLWEKYTKPCIDSIKTKYDHRILLIDNGSTDETKEEAGKLVSNTFSHHRNEQAWCCAKSWNFGVKDAFERGYDYALVLNNDILLHPEAIDYLIGRFEASKQKLVAEPVEFDVLASAEATIQAPVKATHFESEILAMVTAMNIAGECNPPEQIFQKDASKYKIVGEAEHPDFSAFMISKAAYEKVGPFDEGFVPCYFEDNDYHYRVNVAKMKAITFPSAIYYHYGSRTQNEALGGGKLISTNGNFENNRAYYIRKWGGPPGFEQFKEAFNGLK